MYTGLLGRVVIKATNDNSPAPMVAYISNWSVEETADIVEIVKLGGKYKEKLVGQQSWSASADGAVEFMQVNNSDSGQAKLFTAKHTGVPVDCMFYLDTTVGKEVYFTGTGFIESLSVDLSAEDKGNISISINGTGKLALTKPNQA